MLAEIEAAAEKNAKMADAAAVQRAAREARERNGNSRQSNSWWGNDMNRVKYCGQNNEGKILLEWGWSGVMRLR
jgi:hypothetical protein